MDRAVLKVMSWSSLSLETSEDVPVVPDLLLDNTADLGILRRFGVPSTSDD